MSDDEMSAAKNRAARDVQNDTRDYRAMRGQFEWGGMIPDGDPASLPPNRPRILWNTRRNGGAIVPRGGQIEFLDLNQKIRGLFDCQMGTKRRLMVVGDGCPGESNSVGFYIGSHDIEQRPNFQPGVYYSSAATSVRISRFADDLYVAQDSILRLYQTIDSPYGSTGLDMSGSNQDIPVYTLEAPFTGFSAIRDYPFGGLLFMGADNAGSSAIKSWDGITIRDDLTGIPAPTGFGVFRELFIAGFDAATNRIRTRDTGGSWTTYGPPAAGACAFKEGISYKDVFYWTTLGEDIFKFDGTTITRIPIGTTGLAAGSITHGIEVFDGYLFVAYTSGVSARIARFDGTTWVPIHKNLTTQFPACTVVRPLRAYRGSLYAGVIEGGGGGAIYTSPLTVTTGTWVKTPQGAVGTNGDIDQMLVF